MDGIYDIFRGDEKVGKAQVRRKGLYYEFWCCCDLTGTVICRITVKCGQTVENLGIPVPNGDAFYLRKELPVSRFKAGNPAFFVVPRHPEKRDKWVAVKPDEPVSYLKDVKNAVLEIRDGVVGVNFKPSDPAAPGSDPNP